MPSAQVFQVTMSMSKNSKDLTSVDVEKVGSVDRHCISTGFKDFNDKLDVEKYGETKRKLSSRHVALMIIGQSIGTGLFIGLKSPLMTSGSLSLFLGFITWACLVIWPLMQAVGEMCSYLPIKGSFMHFAARWIDPAMGFAVNMVYLYTSCMYICAELSGFTSVISYWTDVNPGVFIAVAFVVLLCFNVLGVNWYGEMEFFSSILKVLLVVGLMSFGLISMCGGNPKHDAYGFQHWKEGGLFRAYLVPGATGKFLGYWNTLIYAAFACGGADMLALIAGELSQPRKNIGLAAKRSYVRIYLFYFGGIFFMNSLCSSVNPTLLAAEAEGKSGAAASPWVIGIESVGVHGLASLVNALVMTSALSCANAFCYGSCRAAYSASLAGYLPRFFSKCNKKGCPYYCVIAVMTWSLLSFLSVGNSTAVVFNWFINLSTTALLCVYIVMWWCYFNFRRALKAQGKEEEFLNGPYHKMPRWCYPYLPIFGLFLNILVLFFNGFWVFFPGQFSAANFLTSYFAPIMFPFLFFGWKFAKKTKMRTPLEFDITTGKEEIDEEEEIERQYLESLPKKEGLLWKVWYKFADICFN